MLNVNSAEVGRPRFTRHDCWGAPSGLKRKCLQKPEGHISKCMGGGGSGAERPKLSSPIGMGAQPRVARFSVFSRKPRNMNLGKKSDF